MEDNLNEDPQASSPRKGRSNAILTYETVERILNGLQIVSYKIDHLRADFAKSEEDVQAGSKDHEVRIRALENTVTALTASRGTATWLFQAMWTVVGGVLAILGYYTLKP